VHVLALRDFERLLAARSLENRVNAQTTISNRYMLFASSLLR